MTSVRPAPALGAADAWAFYIAYLAPCAQAFFQAQDAAPPGLGGRQKVVVPVFTDDELPPNLFRARGAVPVKVAAGGREYTFERVEGRGLVAAARPVEAYHKWARLTMADGRGLHVAAMDAAGVRQNAAAFAAELRRLIGAVEDATGYAVRHWFSVYVGPAAEFFARGG